jgi:SAM-dependent methyltransferase
LKEKFLDLFSRQASTYAAARPSYPDALYQRLAELVPRASTVWDCATGNGQAARDLGRYFDRVIATDASAEQIREAVAAPHVEYRVATAEESGIADRSIGLTTVAQALHWLDFERFYAEVRRVTLPGGVLAAWSYGACNAGADVEELLREFEHVTVGPYWNPGRRWVDEGYRTIPFPFQEVPVSPFVLRTTWTLSQLGEYLRSWSAVAKYRREHSRDPVAPLLERIGQLWGPAPATREITWPLAVRVGRVA